MPSSNERYRPQVDSYLYHLIGEEDSARSFHESFAAKNLKLPEAELLYLEALQEPELRDEGGASNDSDPSTRSAPNPPLNANVGLPANEEPSYAKGIPILLQVRRLDWKGGGVTGFTWSSRIGDIVSGNATPAALETLSDDPDVVRFEVSRDVGEAELDVSVDAVRATNVHVPPVREQGSRALVAVIDSGLDVLHEAFLNHEGRTRIVALWDQRIDDAPPVDEHGNDLYGTLHTETDINRYLDAGAVPQGLGRDPDGHGTHVTSIAVGRAAGSFTGGVAPEALIIFVRAKIDTPHGDPRSIGYSKAHVDALAFIDRVAKRVGLPVAVNVSLGMNAGAHDGTSTLEAAFDNFTSCGRMPGRILVKSAGNAGKNEAHAQVQLGTEQIVHLQWDSERLQRREDLLEVWFHSADDLTFSVSSPSGAMTERIDRRSQPPRTRGKLLNGNKYSMVLDRFHRDNGDSRLSIRLIPGTAPRIETGTWTLRIEAGQVASEGRVDAWMERGRKNGAKFINHVEAECTLSIPGTAHHVIAVAALDRLQQGQVMPYSSRGATRDGRRCPDLGAPGHCIVAAKSQTASDVVAHQGTSMAAPHVTGALALLLSSQHRGDPYRVLNASQARAGLIQSSRGFNGHWNPSRGWGMLDVEALLELFRPAPPMP